MIHVILSILLLKRLEIRSETLLPAEFYCCLYFAHSVLYRGNAEKEIKDTNKDADIFLFKWKIKRKIDGIKH
jgi:hypothetical protein